MRTTVQSYWCSHAREDSTDLMLLSHVTNKQVKANLLPQLPRYKELVSDLSPIHARLSCENALAKKHPIYKCNEVQVLIFV